MTLGLGDHGDGASDMWRKDCEHPVHAELSSRWVRARHLAACEPNCLSVCSPIVDGVLVLGEVTCPSGHLVVMDGGYLSLWSGDRSPALTDPRLLGARDETMAWNIRAAVDFEITGPDAVEAARAFDRQAGLTCYDIPRHGVSDFVAAFD